MSKPVHSATAETEDTAPFPTARQLAGPIAYAVKIGDVEGEKVARRNLAEAKIADAIDRALAVAPPLTPAQARRLSGLLRTGGQS